MGLFLVYLGCLGFGLIFTLISAFMADVFGGHDVGGHDIGGHDVGGHDAGGHDAQDLGTAGHAEAGYDMPGFSVFSPTVVASFVTAFGGFGMIFSKIKATSSPWLSAPLAAACAFLAAAGVVWLFRQIFRRTQSSSESVVATLVGVTASVISPIPENGVGEIAYVQSGSRYSAPAREESGLPLPAGQPVRITRIVGSQFYVAKL
jgi:membrane protein implicated in regulation of membrane protease activity